MGVYELMEGKEVNGRGVWQMAGGQQYFMYYGSNKQWLISAREAMEAGKAAGWMYVDSTALTPDQVTETWKVWDGTEMVAAQKVRARMCSAKERQQVMARMQQAMAAAYESEEISRTFEKQRKQSERGGEELRTSEEARREEVMSEAALFSSFEKMRELEFDEGVPE
jgi:hypothetical protein